MNSWIVFLQRGLGSGPKLKIMLWNKLWNNVPVSVFSVKEPLGMTRLENNTKPEKPKPVRRKTVADSFIAPMLDTKSTQYPAIKGM